MAASSRGSPLRPDRDAGLLALEVALGVLVGHLGGEEAGCDGVHADALAAGPLLGEVAGQADQAGLGRGVRRLGETGGGEPEDRGDVDDRGARLHHATARLRHPVAAVEVDVDDLAELLGRLAGGGDGGADARVVDEHVDPAEGPPSRRPPARWHASGEATSVSTAMARRPAPSTSAAVSASRSTRRAPRTTSAPASAKPWANATPSPEEAPVTMATLPSRENRSVMEVMRPIMAGGRRQPSRAAARPPGRADHVLEAVPHLPVEVARRGLARGHDAGRVARRGAGRSRA